MAYYMPLAYRYRRISCAHLHRPCDHGMRGRYLGLRWQIRSILSTMNIPACILILIAVYIAAAIATGHFTF
jgi:hypothetical protein